MQLYSHFGPNDIATLRQILEVAASGAQTSTILVLQSRLPKSKLQLASLFHRKKSVAARLGPTLPLSWIQNSAAVSVSVLPWTMVLPPELNQERSPGVVPSAACPSQWNAWSPAWPPSGSMRARSILSWPWTKSVITSRPVLVAGLFWALV